MVLVRIVRSSNLLHGRMVSRAASRYAVSKISSQGARPTTAPGNDTNARTPTGSTVRNRSNGSIMRKVQKTRTIRTVRTVRTNRTIRTIYEMVIDCHGHYPPSRRAAGISRRRSRRSRIRRRRPEKLASITDEQLVRAPPSCVQRDRARCEDLSPRASRWPSHRRCEN